MPTSTASLHSRSSSEPFVFIGDRLWLDFVNSDDGVRREGGNDIDALDSFVRFMDWLQRAGLLDDDRAAALLRRAQQQPTGASSLVHEARRLRGILRELAERRDNPTGDATAVALAEINRILGRSAGARRVEPHDGGGFVRNFVTVGDVFAGLLAPVIESAADALVRGELARVRTCAGARCARVFYDASRNGKRRWCEMATCGNRAKAARHRRRLRSR